MISNHRESTAVCYRDSTLRDEGGGGRVQTEKERRGVISACKLTQTLNESF